MSVDLRKGANSCKMPNFGTFQDITISKQWEGLWLYSWFMGTSSLLLHKSYVWSCR